MCGQVPRCCDVISHNPVIRPTIVSQLHVRKCLLLLQLFTCMLRNSNVCTNVLASLRAKAADGAFRPKPMLPLRQLGTHVSYAPYYGLMSAILPS